MPYIAIGKIRKPFGLKGFTFIEPLTHSVDRFFDIEKCFLGLNEKFLQPVQIEEVELKGGKLTLKFEGFDDRTEVEKVTNYFLFVNEEDSVKPPDTGYFLHELSGLKVESKDGLNLGVVKNVLEMPAQNIIVINYNGKEVLVPKVDEFVVSIDLKKQKLVLNVIEGLFE